MTSSLGAGAVPVAGRIVILPFEDLGGDPSRAYFARSFVDDLAIELSRFAALDVVHPRTALPALEAGPPDDVDAPPTFLLEGSVRWTDGAVRLSVRLVERGSNRQVWAERYETPMAKLQDVEDEIASRVAGALAIQVDEVRLVAARRKPTASLAAYDSWLRGLDCLQRGTAAADEEARGYFEQALAADASFPRAYAGLSLTHFNEWSCQVWEKWDEKERLAFEYARRAAELDDRDALVQVVLGRVYLYRCDFDRAAYHIQRALALNPNDGAVLAHAAMCLVFLGDAGAALQLATRAIEQTPHHRQWYLVPAAMALFMLGRHAEAVERAGRAPDAMVDQSAWLAAACARAGDADRAAHFLRRFRTEFVDRITFGRAPDPGEALRWLLHVNPFRREDDRREFESALLLAGLDTDPDAERPEARVGAPAQTRPLFLRAGVLWRMAFDGQEVQLTEVKGFGDLAALLARPGVAMHCLELADRPADPAGADLVVDDRARREIRDRVRELQREIDAADADRDLARGGAARQELDAIVETLSGALGLGGRSRALGSAAERARSAVTWRIRSAIRKIAAVHPRLGRHLENSVRTGTYCEYAPETPVDWQLNP